MTRVIFTNEDVVIPEEFSFGDFKGEEESEWISFEVQHDSRKPIRNCSFYISPSVDDYQGSLDAETDYRNLLWLADNYEGYGLQIRQVYDVYSQVEYQGNRRLIDTTRQEVVDIFAGSEIEMTDGDSGTERQRITSYDGSNGLFFLEGDFSTDVVGHTYRVRTERLDFVKTKSGSSSDFPIDLLYGGGVIDRFVQVRIECKIKIPPYFKQSSINNIDFNLKFVAEED